jgi:hypothetical protein
MSYLKYALTIYWHPKTSKRSAGGSPTSQAEAGPNNERSNLNAPIVMRCGADAPRRAHPIRRQKQGAVLGFSFYHSLTRSLASRNPLGTTSRITYQCRKLCRAQAPFARKANVVRMESIRALNKTLSTTTVIASLPCRKRGSIDIIM